ncbi:MAG: carboxypeptidase regulatory-like domain-containing protein [Acidobacteria bacterium]|nr:MAG: carboxypeptidase regulatory-like domain-containing protein [Acidobacteriota bacterium]
MAENSSKIQVVNRFRPFAATLLFTLLCAVSGRAEDLKLLVSVQQQSIMAPNPLRATLRFHNSGSQTLWLYRPVLSEIPGDRLGAVAPRPEELRPGEAYGGSRLEIHMAPQNAPAQGSGGNVEAGSGFALAPDALPYPRLVRLAPGGDYEEKVSIHVEPAEAKSGTGNQPVWGPYQFSVVYSADYSNADSLARNMSANLWHGQATSNTVTLELRPSPGRGSIEGTAVDSFERPYGDALVTLSNDNENPLDQIFSDGQGRFSFARLSPGRYWLAVRAPASEHDTSVFRQVEVGETASPATADIMMLPVESDRGDRLLHKPVLYHIVDNQGHPLANVRIAILYSAGNVVENQKAQTGDDGFAAVSLIPGTIYVTLQTAGCKKQERRADVVPGPGVDGFKFTYDCSGN